MKDTLLRDDRFIDAADGVQCNGSVVPLTNLYPVQIAAAEWEGFEPTDNRMPDPRAMSALIFERTSSAWIAEVGSMLAQELEMPVWFIDSTGTAWPSDRVDADRISLA